MAFMKVAWFQKTVITHKFRILINIVCTADHKFGMDRPIIQARAYALGYPIAHTSLPHSSTSPRLVRKENISGNFWNML
eukprot:5107309-Karenia_brevis.AAC.1